MKKKRKTGYMHTLNGSPAGFMGTQVCYACTGRYGNRIKLCGSLKELRAEQVASELRRSSEGIKVNGDTLGYVKVAL